MTEEVVPIVVLESEGPIQQPALEPRMLQDMIFLRPRMWGRHQMVANLTARTLQMVQEVTAILGWNGPLVNVTRRLHTLDAVDWYGPSFHSEARRADTYATSVIRWDKQLVKQNSDPNEFGLDID